MVAVPVQAPYTFINISPYKTLSTHRPNDFLLSNWQNTFSFISEIMIEFKSLECAQSIQWISIHDIDVQGCFLLWRQLFFILGEYLHFRGPFVHSECPTVFLKFRFLPFRQQEWISGGLAWLADIPPRLAVLPLHVLFQRLARAKVRAAKGADNLLGHFLLPPSVPQLQDLLHLD